MRRAATAVAVVVPLAVLDTDVLSLLDIAGSTRSISLANSRATARSTRPSYMAFVLSLRRSLRSSSRR